MPRPNQPRSIASEQHVAQRIAQERERRGMSYEALAIQMKHHGCPINASALFRIEKGDPPRRITVDELVAFSEVFGVPVEELLLPPEVAASKELTSLVVAWDRAREEALAASESERAAWKRLTEYVEPRPELAEAVETAMRTWVEHYVETEDPAWREFRVADWMRRLTKSPEWKSRAKELFDQVVADDQATDEGPE